ncbi:multidrug effflux MFS transporter [Pseudarthrobacter sulfonivorans]|uniref:multidrug effflux MFS transporter n=1 Tax=Pseudarthrobacter sulfonivorans TaxID=121292 RepID=UPI00285B5F53|nr:multidrug effflux MFS transporter [Pseudarthrobacter sulfonivorans]MDR6417607.1 DHA1 family bicyclomycin/chloramphenicol resistance-like MFS transporter [Pseudarthrobacter sulfonivorans]
MLSLGVLTAVGPFSLDTYLPAFPAIASDLQAGPEAVQLSLTACLVGLAFGQLLVGPLGDRIGRRTPLLLGSVGFLFASIGCAFAPSIEIFIGMRFVQGLAGAAGLVMARAVVRDISSGRTATTLYSQLAIVSGLAPVVAPLLGAAGLVFLSWRGVFLGLAVLGAILTVLVATMVPETHHRESRTNGGLSATLGAFGQVLADRAFAGYVVLSGLTAAILFTYIASSSFVFQGIYGATPAQFAAAFAVNGLGIALLGRLNVSLAPRHGPARMLRIGVALQFAGTVLLMMFVLLEVDLGEFKVVGLAAALFLAIAPLGLNLPNTMAICMGQSGGHSGTASALLGVTTFLSGALVTPISGLGHPATAMVLIMGGAAALSIVTVLVLKRRVQLLET